MCYLSCTRSSNLWLQQTIKFIVQESRNFCRNFIFLFAPVWVFSNCTHIQSLCLWKEPLKVNTHWMGKVVVVVVLLSLVAAVSVNLKMTTAGAAGDHGWQYQWIANDNVFCNVSLARYVKLRVAHAPGMPVTFSPPPRVSDPGMHHGTCVTHVPWYMSRSLTSAAHLC